MSSAENFTQSAKRYIATHHILLTISSKSNEYAALVFKTPNLTAADDI